jgi:hypothetical protein
MPPSSLNRVRVLLAEQAPEAMAVFPLAAHQMQPAPGISCASAGAPRLWLMILNEALVPARLDPFDRFGLHHAASKG